MKIYITWHYTTHGIAFLKHILSAFYTGRVLLTDKPIKVESLSQSELNKAFSEHRDNGFLFDKVFYLSADQSAFDKIASRRKIYRKGILEDEAIIQSGMHDVFNRVLLFDSQYINKEIEFVAANFPDQVEKFKELLWRDVQHYQIAEQLKWFTTLSNAKDIYSGKFEMVRLDGISDLRDEQQITNCLQKWIKEIYSKYPEAEFVINVSLGSNETQVAWHCIGEAGLLPKNTRFIKTYDDKSDETNSRFKKFSVVEIKTNLISEIGTSIKLYENTKSELRKLSDLKMKSFIDAGFAILIMGERGTGKSELASKYNKANSKFTPANCASFADDSMAESELFGYVKGAFTGATINKSGLFQEANNGILFLDEIHHLSKMVQAKLMKALQTDKDNCFTIRPLGSTKEVMVNCKVVFATNKSVSELKELLLPDFYDRIVQHVIDIPPLRQTKEDRVRDWESVWGKLKFLNKTPAPIDKTLMKWLDNLPLYGNFRDLQKIAMYYNVYNSFEDETKLLCGHSNAFSYAKSEFEKYHSPITDINQEYVFSEGQTTEMMSKEYFSALSLWAIKKYKSASKAVKHFKDLGEDISEKTLYNWKNKL